VSPVSPTAPTHIIVRGAREHNLRGIDLRIPRDRLVVITGLSGSGKSSLAFDTIYAEGQRRYVESLSAYARQFLEQMSKPDVDSIEGLSPAISIEQRTLGKNPRSTVGTATEISDHLRLLYARAGQPHCWLCGKPISSQTVQQMTDRVLDLDPGSRLQVLAPVVRGRKGEYRKELESFRRQGYVRARIDGVLIDLGDDVSLAKQVQHDIDLVVDRLEAKAGARARLAESLETALRLGSGLVKVDVGPGREEWLLSEANACIDCGVSFPEIAPRLFSFNSPHGACPGCGGLGTRDEFDPARIVPDPDRSLDQGAIEPWRERRTARYYAALLASLAEHLHFQLDSPWRKLPKRVQRALLFGTGRELVRFSFPREGRNETVRRRWDGVLGELERRRRATSSATLREELSRYMSPQPCTDCDGSRLRAEARSVKIGGLGIDAVSRLSTAQAAEFLEGLVLAPVQREIADRILREIRERLRFLSDVGLEYLTLDRASATLSGGEGQRIRLATQVGSSLMGVLYVLDEPSIGLHARDHRRLLASLKRRRRSDPRTG
jgi:excinuclease ABC subunit A